MLHAKLHGKLRYDAEGKVKLQEDSLTSTVFERLAYLPDRQFVAILFDPSLWPLHPLSRRPASLGSITFWPLWPWPKATTPTVTRRSIEPDLVIEFDDRILIVEAKRYDETLAQYGDQLADEWWTARHIFTDGRPISILAISGLRNPKHELKGLKREALNRLTGLSPEGQLETFDLGYASWRDLYLLTRTALSHDRPEQCRLLDDIGSGLIRHGVRLTEPCWLDELPTKSWVALKTPFAAGHFRRPDLPPLTSQGGIRTSPDFFQGGQRHERF